MRDLQVERRRQRAAKEGFVVRNVGDREVFSHFQVQRPGGSLHTVQIRTVADQGNTCSCPDYQTNLLGTCKHIEAVLLHLRTKKGRMVAAAEGRGPDVAQVALTYGDEVSVTVTRPSGFGGKAAETVDSHFDRTGRLRSPALRHMSSFLRDFDALAPRARCRIQVADDVRRRAVLQAEGAVLSTLKEDFVGRARTSPGALRVVDAELYPYQIDGMLHLAFGGRTMLADDMGLGKTVQAIAACALLQRERGIGRVLVVTPASLKHQWRREIGRFTSLSATVVEGPADKRALLYAAPSFFTIVNYELLLRDGWAFQHLAPDVVVLDEAQRIKNWRTKTAAAVKQLQSRHAFVLTGTPLENKLDELYGVMQFLDPRLLGPLWHFNERYFLLERKRSAVKVLGHKNLDELRSRLAPVVLRRRKEAVLQDLPERIDNDYFVEMSPEQAAPYGDYLSMVAQLAARASHRPLTEPEIKRMMMGMTKMRVICDALELHDPKIPKAQRESTAPKLAELRTILREQVVECGRKAILFSSFEGMVDLVAERVLEPMKVPYVKLSGSVPTDRRGALIDRFNDDDSCRVFLSTDAGGTGLNLQAASLVVNVDVPWNPAVLDQRVGRAHRHGQKNAVNVINLVTRGAIEERMLETMADKRAVFAGVFDEDGVDELTFDRRKGLLQRVGQLLGTAPAPEATVEAPPVESAAVAPPAVPLETLWVDDLEAALGLALLLVRPLAGLPVAAAGGSPFLVVVEGPVVASRRTVEGLTTAFNERHSPPSPFVAHLFDRAGFEALRSLFGDALDGPASPPALHRATSLHGGAGAEDPEAALRRRRTAEARARLDRAADRLRLAAVLSAGGFAVEAAPALDEAMACGLHALALHEGVLPPALEGEAPAPALLQIELGARQALAPDLAGRLAQARELSGLVRNAPDPAAAAHHLTFIDETARTLIELAAGRVAAE